MPWKPEDWKGWSDDNAARGIGDPAQVHVLADILSRLPEPDVKHLARLGSSAPTHGSFADDRFARVIRRDLTHATLDDLGGPFDVIVVDSSQAGPDLDVDRLFEQVRDALVEGGVFLAAFPARPRGFRPLTFYRSAQDQDGSLEFHEVELQYRLHRAGYQGLRLRRIGPASDEPATLICMAVRRASN